MRKLAIVFIILSLAMSALAFAQGKAKPYRIAILEFDPVTAEAEKDNLGRVSSEFLLTAAVNSGTFGVVERAAIKRVLDEMQFGQGSQAPSSVAQAIGGMVGAQGVLTGSVAKTGQSVRLDARLIDVVSGNIVAARSAYAKGDLRSIATAAELLVSQLDGDLARLTPPAAETVQAGKEPEKTKENQADAQAVKAEEPQKQQ